MGGSEFEDRTIGDFDRNGSGLILVTRHVLRVPSLCLHCPLSASSGKLNQHKRKEVGAAKVKSGYIGARRLSKTCHLRLQLGIC